MRWYIYVRSKAGEMAIKNKEKQKPSSLDETVRALVSEHSPGERIETKG